MSVRATEAKAPDTGPRAHAPAAVVARLAALALLATLAAAGPAHAQTRREGLRFDYATGSSPFAVTVADMDQDGWADVLVANAASRTVSLLLADGHGGFQPKRDLPVGYGPRGIVVADVNRDGWLDIVTANSTDNTVSVLRGTVRAGYFLSPLDYPTGSAPRAIAVADLNGDGAPDLVTANYFGGGVTVLLNDGHGAFGARQDLVTGTAPAGVALGDLDGDGHADLAVANSSSNTVAVLPGDGHGGFGPRTTTVVGTSPTGVAIGDVDGDGRLDVVSANTNAGTATVLRGDGHGQVTRAFDLITGLGPTAVAIADYDGDGRADVLVTNVRANTISWFAADGAGVFRPRVDIGTGPMPTAIVVAELNGDGRPELVTPNNTAASVCIDYGDFSEGLAPRTDVPLPGAPTAFAVGDLDGDHRVDAVVANFDSSTVTVLRGDGDAGFTRRYSMPVPGGPLGVALADLDEDGVLDLVTTSSSDATVNVWFGRFDGTFPQPPTSYPVGRGAGQVVVRDVMGESAPDLVVVDEQDNSVSVLIGLGGGRFGAATDWAAGASPRSIAIADLNTDGRADIVAAEFNSRSIAVLINNAGVGFLAPQETAVSGLNPSAVVAGKLDGDAFADLVVASYGSSAVEVLFGNGSGGFSSGVEIEAGAGPRALALADLNADGALDLLVCNALAGTVSVMLGNGAGVFAAHTDVATGARPVAALGIDPDGSGGPLHLLTLQYDARTLADFAPRSRTATTLERWPLVSIVGQSVALTARVTRLDRSAPAPTGAVRFYDGASEIGRATLADTVATLAFDGLAIGPHVLRAEYAGDARTTGSATAPTVARVHRCATMHAHVSPGTAFEGETVRLDVDGVPDVTAVRFGGVPARDLAVTPTWFAPDSAAVVVSATVPVGATSGAVQVEGPCGIVATDDVFDMRRRFVFATARTGGFGYLAGVGWPVLPSLGDTLGVPPGALALAGREDDDWRVRAWNPAAQAYERVATLRTGRGYWIQTRGPWSVEVTGSVERDTTLVLPLAERGWYLLGNPFPRPIPVASLQVMKRGIARPLLHQTDVMRTVFTWDAGAHRYVAADEIPGEAVFWVRRLSLATAESLLVPPPGSALPVPAPDDATPLDWSARLIASSGESRAAVSIGVAAVADDAPHAATAWAPPAAPGEALSLVLRDARAAEPERYASLVLDRADSPAWTLELASASAPGEVELELDADALPAGRVLVLEDAGGAREVLAPGVPVTRAAPASARTLTLRLVNASEALASVIVEDVRAYPTPFAGATGFRFRHASRADLRVTVFDLAGRAVRTLERRSVDAGEHVLVWDGRDASGAAVPAAVYFARCRAGGFERVLRVVRVR